MRTDAEHRGEFSDFTEAGYRELLQIAKTNYAFARFGESRADRHVLWRHDIDVSFNRALRLAQIEREEGVTATYFFFPRSIFYNLLNDLTKSVAKQILELGHDIALHFDPTQYGPGLSRASLLEAMTAERDLLQREFGVPPRAVSFHLYGVLEEPMPDDDEVAGMINAYSKSLRDTYDYASDSNGVWIYRRLRDVLLKAEKDRLQVLTHPEWWTGETMPPRLRLQRAIDGYAAAMAKWYDDIVAKSGRPNLR
ncbi:MAG: hypothetical protein Q8922_14560 [Bacteroidota bacterium]|nr:hypothetical protein [Bacteroidota bacterium]